MLKTPLIELLGYMVIKREEDEAERKNEEARIWINYFSMVHSHPLSESSSPEQKQSRQKFIESIKPKQRNTAPKLNKVYEWDFKQLERMKAMQEGG